MFRTIDYVPIFLQFCYQKVLEFIQWEGCPQNFIDKAKSKTYFELLSDRQYGVSSLNFALVFPLGEYQTLWLCPKWFLFAMLRSGQSTWGNSALCVWLFMLYRIVIVEHYAKWNDRHCIPLLTAMVKNNGTHERRELNNGYRSSGVNETIVTGFKILGKRTL